MYAQHGADSLSGYTIATHAIRLLQSHMSEREELYSKHMTEWMHFQKRWKLKADLRMISTGRSCAELDNALHKVALYLGILRRQHIELLQFYHRSIQRWIEFQVLMLSLE